MAMLNGTNSKAEVAGPNGPLGPVVVDEKGDGYE